MTSVDILTPTQLAEYRPGASLGPRQQLHWELIWLLRGSLEWVVDATPEAGASAGRHLLVPGQLALARKGIWDTYYWDRQRATVHAYLHFTLLEHEWPIEGLPGVVELAEFPLLDALCDHLIELGGVDTPAAWDRTNRLVALILDLLAEGRLADPATALRPEILRLATAVQSIWRRDGLRILAANELADAMGMSTGHLFRLFRSALACGPAEALELVRLSRAAEALQRTNATIAETARDHGFANAYHFSRRFSSAYGVPPGRFRQTLDLDALGPVRAAGLLSFAHVLTNR